MPETAPADVMAEIVRLRDMIRSLAAERNDLRGALRRHTRTLTDARGSFCAGCLEPAPCPDTALLSEVNESSEQETGR